MHAFPRSLTKLWRYILFLYFQRNQVVKTQDLEWPHVFKAYYKYLTYKKG